MTHLNVNWNAASTDFVTVMSEMNCEIITYKQRLMILNANEAQFNVLMHNV